eukprot:3292841-Rhodomonas_salina.3
MYIAVWSLRDFDMYSAVSCQAKRGQEEGKHMLVRERERERERMPRNRRLETSLSVLRWRGLVFDLGKQQREEKGMRERERESIGASAQSRAQQLSDYT